MLMPLGQSGVWWSRFTEITIYIELELVNTKLIEWFYFHSFQAHSRGSVDLIVQVMDEGVCRIRNNKGNIKLKPQPKQQLPATPQEVTKPKVHWIDRLSRFIFPTCYVTFLVAYTIYYGVLREENDANENVVD